MFIHRITSGHGPEEICTVTGMPWLPKNDRALVLSFYNTYTDGFRLTGTASSDRSALPEPHTCRAWPAPLSATRRRTRRGAPRRWPCTADLPRCSDPPGWDDDQTWAGESSHKRAESRSTSQDVYLLSRTKGMMSAGISTSPERKNMR